MHTHQSLQLNIRTLSIEYFQFNAEFQEAEWPSPNIIICWIKDFIREEWTEVKILRRESCIRNPGGKTKLSARNIKVGILKKKNRKYGIVSNRMDLGLAV